jgi:ArsR family transcriptional regulator, arsenate/arsenite/antimonite-responsive transcriptional repressor
MASNAGEIEAMARRLAALGQPTRLALFCRIVQAGPAGHSVGELQSALGIPLSTLSFHLRRLVDAGLVAQEREGTYLRCCCDQAALTATQGFLRQACCPPAAQPPGRKRAQSKQVA